MKPVRIALVGAGAFGTKHLEAFHAIEHAHVACIVDTDGSRAQDVAKKFGVDDTATKLEEVLRRDDVDAVVLCTPTPQHAWQAAECLAAGKHVMTEIPLADNLADAEHVVTMQERTGLVAMCGHTRRFNPSHQYLHQKIEAGELALQHLDVQTYFLRRTNINALGQPRTWTDHLLWHHASHTVDLFAWQTGSPIVAANAIQGPVHPSLGIAMDMSIQLKAQNGALCTLSLSFNNDGPIGSFFRYICDRGTYVARYDELVTGQEERVDVSHVAVSASGIELQDREFIAAIQEGREPESSVAKVLGCYRVLHQLDQELQG
ncbi:MAG: Gfo/Idh/MocA family oxidoreductase [Polaromonas sp.]